MAAGSKVVVDASCVLSLLLDEEPDRSTKDLQEGYLSGRYDLIAPTLIHYEVGNALRSAVLQKRLSPEQAEAALESYQEIMTLTVDPSPALRSVSLALALKHRCSVYDASYLALARTLATRLVTLDKKLQGIWQSEGLA